MTLDQLDQDDINTYLKGMCKQLMYKRNMRNITLAADTGWLNQFEHKPAVYILFNKRKNRLVYVGETVNLRRRMRDLRNRHSVRKRIREEIFKVSQRPFPPNMKKKVTNYIEKHLKLSFWYVELGRIELEEWILEKLKPEFNIIGNK